MKILPIYEGLLESNILKIAYKKIDELPDVSLSRNLKEIHSIFKLFNYTRKELDADVSRLDNFMYVDVMDIRISQPFINEDNVKWIMDNMDKSAIVHVFELSDGEKVIYDGHHRLVAHWALGEKRIKVNLIPAKARYRIKSNK